MKLFLFTNANKSLLECEHSGLPTTVDEKHPLIVSYCDCDSY